MRRLMAVLVVCAAALAGSPALADKGGGTDKKSGSGGSPSNDKRSGNGTTPGSNNRPGNGSSPGNTGRRERCPKGMICITVTPGSYKTSPNPSSGTPGTGKGTPRMANDVRDPSGGFGAGSSHGGATDFTRGGGQGLSPDEALRAVYDYTSSMPAPPTPASFKREYNRAVVRGIAEEALEAAHKAQLAYEFAHKKAGGVGLGIMTYSKELGKCDVLDSPDPHCRELMGRSSGPAAPRGHTPSPRH